MKLWLLVKSIQVLPTKMASKLYGDWGKLQNLSELMNTKESVMDKMLENAKEMNTQIRETLKNGKAQGNPLKPETIKSKGHGTKLYDTGKLANSFNVDVLGDSVVVVPKGYHGEGLTNEQLALIHENGNSKIPSRPFIQPVWEEHEKKVKQEVSKAVETVISNL